MTQFSSRPPFNNDPRPWTDPRGDNRHGPYGGWSSEYNPRPEFDRPQHNPTNPILAGIRGNIVAAGGIHRDRAHYWRDAAQYLTGGTHAMEVPIPHGAAEHARKVLTRLAALA